MTKQSPSGGGEEEEGPSFAEGVEEVISGLSSEVVELTKQLIEERHELLRLKEIADRYAAAEQEAGAQRERADNAEKALSRLLRLTKAAAASHAQSAASLASGAGAQPAAADAADLASVLPAAGAPETASASDDATLELVRALSSRARTAEALLADLSAKHGAAQAELWRLGQRNSDLEEAVVALRAAAAGAAEAKAEAARQRARAEDAEALASEQRRFLAKAEERKEAAQAEVAVARREAEDARRTARQAAASAGEAAASSRRRAPEPSRGRQPARAASAPRYGGRRRFCSSSSSSSGDDAGPERGASPPEGTGAAWEGAATAGIWGENAAAREGRRAFRLPAPREDGRSPAAAADWRRRAQSHPASPQRPPQQPPPGPVPLAVVNDILGAAMLAVVEQALGRANPAGPGSPQAPFPVPPQQQWQQQQQLQWQQQQRGPPAAAVQATPARGESSLGARYASSSSSLSSLDGAVGEDSAFQGQTTPLPGGTPEARGQPSGGAAASAPREILRGLGTPQRAAPSAPQSPMAARVAEEREVAQVAADAVAKAQAAMRELEARFRGEDPGADSPGQGEARTPREAPEQPRPAGRAASVPVSPARQGPASPLSRVGSARGSPAGGAGGGSAAPSPHRASLRPPLPPGHQQEEGEGEAGGCSSAAAPEVSPIEPARGARRKLRGDMDWLLRRAEEKRDSAVGGEGGATSNGDGDAAKETVDDDA